MLLTDVGHLLLASALTLLVYQLSATVGVIASVVIVLVVLVDVVWTLGLDIKTLRRKQ